MARTITVMMPDGRLYSLHNPQRFSTLSGLLQDYGIERKGLIVAIDQDIVSNDSYSELLDEEVKSIFLMFQRVDTLSHVLVESLKAPVSGLDVPYDVIDIFSLGNVEPAKQDFVRTIVRGHFVPLHAVNRYQFYLYYEAGDTIEGFLNQCYIPSSEVGIRIYQGKKVIWRGDCLKKNDPRLTDLMVADSVMIVESKGDFVIEDAFNRLLFSRPAVFVPGIMSQESLRVRPANLSTAAFAIKWAYRLSTANK